MAVTTRRAAFAAAVASLFASADQWLDESRAAPVHSMDLIPNSLSSSCFSRKRRSRIYRDHLDRSMGSFFEAFCRAWKTGSSVDDGEEGSSFTSESAELLSFWYTRFLSSFGRRRRTNTQRKSSTTCSLRKVRPAERTSSSSMASNSMSASIPSAASRSLSTSDGIRAKLGLIGGEKVIDPCFGASSLPMLLFRASTSPTVH
mmetsp:Transcript_20440/g.59186  ORF Transcript_20440/g.59186 Transcript_20440/m.59186 type:complete len:202 (+) Transcript_20440:1051-1656(+)